MDCFEIFAGLEKIVKIVLWFRSAKHVTKQCLKHIKVQINFLKS